MTTSPAPPTEPSRPSAATPAEPATTGAERTVGPVGPAGSSASARSVPTAVVVRQRIAAARRMLALVGRLVLAMALIAVVGFAAWAVSRAVTPDRELPTDLPALPITPAAVTPGVELPAGGRPAPQAAPGADPVGDWSDRTSPAVDIPARALRAYGVADLALRTEAPRCRVTWATLAGIGRIESDHGRFAGAVLAADGRPSRAIIGVPLNGSPGLATITDTDGGRLDGDVTHDRAVGPMQFIPGTWARWGADADGDGRADPQDIDDAALAAGRYLCAGGRDLGTAGGWWAGVLSYNNSVEYGRKVFGVADAYARRSTG